MDDETRNSNVCASMNTEIANDVKQIGRMRRVVSSLLRGDMCFGHTTIEVGIKNFNLKKKEIFGTNFSSPRFYQMKI